MEPPIEKHLAEKTAQAQAKAERKIARIRARTQARIQQLHMPRGKRLLFRLAVVTLATAVAAVCVLMTEKGRDVLHPSSIRRALAPANVIYRVRAFWGSDTLADETARARQNTTEAFQEYYSDDERRLLTAAGYDPESALIVRANFDTVLAFSPRVMEADATRGYRFRTGTRAVWAEGRERERGTDYFLLPDTPEIRTLVSTTPGWRVMLGSEESYNQFGFRSDEPDPAAECTGVLLGDSFMECPLVEQPRMVSAQLERLSKQEGMPMQWINTGHPGYSTEQEYQTLVWLCEQCCGDSEGHYKKPVIVVLNVYANDVHHRADGVMYEGKGDWSGFAASVQKIREYCQRRKMKFVVCVVPDLSQIRAPMRRSLRNYQQQVAISANMTPLHFIDPLHEMAREDARLSQLTRQEDPLYAVNKHFSAAGAESYARGLWQTLRIILGRDRAHGGVE